VLTLSGHIYYFMTVMDGLFCLRMDCVVLGPEPRFGRHAYNTPDTAVRDRRQK